MKNGEQWIHAKNSQLLASLITLLSTTLDQTPVARWDFLDLTANSVSGMDPAPNRPYWRYRIKTWVRCICWSRKFKFCYQMNMNKRKLVKFVIFTFKVMVKVISGITSWLVKMGWFMKDEVGELLDNIPLVRTTRQ